jgi:hypothetical protein
MQNVIEISCDKATQKLASRVDLTIIYGLADPQIIHIIEKLESIIGVLKDCIEPKEEE